MSMAVDPTKFSCELLLRLQSESILPPERLADLFQMAVSKDPIQKAVFDTVQKYLLDKTIAHAHSTADFYRDNSAYNNWRSANDGLRADLRALPVLTRLEITTDLKRFLANDVHLRGISHTSGSTGSPLDLYRSHEEVDFIFAYYAHFFKKLSGAFGELPLVLSFPNSYHGVPLPMPGVGMTFVGGVTDDTLIQDAVRVLRTEYDIPGYAKRISILSGLQHHILLFTHYLLQQGLSPETFRLASVNITGGYSSSHEREFLARAWGAVVYDRFTLTETVGGASRCFKCDKFHLDQQIFGEVVDIDTFEPLDEGVGSLVLTTLYPFAQMQPLIRYSPGDLVRKVESECTNGLSFEFLGKAKNCISEIKGHRREWLIFSACLNEILATFPDINAYDWFANVRVVEDRTVGSLPRAAVSVEKQEEKLLITLHVELRYSPHAYEERLEQISEVITSHLFSVPSTTLKQRVDDGSIIFKILFCGPGGLKQPITIKI